MHNTHYYYYIYYITSSVYTYVVYIYIYIYGRIGKRTGVGGDGGNYSGCFCSAAAVHGIINFYIIIITCVYIGTCIIHVYSWAQKLRRFYVMIMIIILYVDSREYPNKTGRKKRRARRIPTIYILLLLLYL